MSPNNADQTSSKKAKAAGAIEEMKLASNQLVDRVRDLIEEGNVRHIKIKKDQKVLLELPLTVGVGAGAAAVLLSPILAAVGALAALVTDITLVVERDPNAQSGTQGGQSGSQGGARSGGGNAGNSGNSGGGNSGGGDSTSGQPAQTPASKPVTDQEGSGGDSGTQDKTIGK